MSDFSGMPRWSNLVSLIIQFRSNNLPPPSGFWERLDVDESNEEIVVIEVWSNIISKLFSPFWGHFFWV